jgi:hypothetical protein
MPSRHDESMSRIPRGSAPWAAGWTAMSDISRIETDVQGFNGQAQVSRRANPLRRTRAIGLAVGALTTIGFAAMVLL